MCQKINIGDLAEELAGRGAVYDTLRRIFLFGPTREWLTEMVDLALTCEDNVNSNMPLWEQEFSHCLRTLKPEQTGQVSQELTLEFTRLFIGPYHLTAPPYESVYRSAARVMMQESTLEVRANYQAAGLVIKNLNHEPDDHIGLELEFMYFLNSKSLEALQQRDFSAMFTAVQFQDRFLTEHVTQWVPAFCDDIAANTRHEFFRRLAEYIRGFIVEDCSVVQVLAPVLQNFLQA